MPVVDRQSGRLVIPVLFIAALALRPEVIGIGPLLETIQHRLGVSHSVAGLLPTIVVLCMGVFAPLGFVVARRVGLRSTIGGSLLLVALAGIGRALTGPAWAVILLTVPIGVGTAVAGSVMPVVVRQASRGRPVFGTALYTTGFSIGGAVSAAVAVPLAAALGGWRGALLAFSLFALVVAGIWAALSGGFRSHELRATRSVRLPVRSRTGWLLVAIFTLAQFTFFAVNAWLPATYTARGWSAAHAGELLTVINGVTVPLSLLVALRGDRRGSRRAWLLRGAVLQLAALLGVLLAPEGGWAWAVLFGAASGLLFPSVMMMRLDVAHGADEVAAMSALMLGCGLTLSSAGPVLAGLVSDLTGGFTVAFAGIAALTAIAIVLFASVTEEGLRRDPRERGRQPVIEHA